MAVSFISSGQKVYVESFPEGARNVKLPPAIYSLESSREEGLFLLKIQDSYILPEKVYDNLEQVAAKVIRTHHNKQGNTGVLLTGLKGTGKSLFVKFISNQMLSQGFPVIQINKAYGGEELINFVENLGDCVLLFDEFGKHYTPYSNHSPGAPSQNSLLSMLDGLSNSKRLHLFTENDPNDISEYLINRPGRVHYHFKYNRLSNKVIEELCKDAQLPEDITKELIALSSKIRVLSFDAIKCLIDEWKLHGGELEQLLNTLNITLINNNQNHKLELLSYVDIDGNSHPVDKFIVKLGGESFTISPRETDPMGRLSPHNVLSLGFFNLTSIKNDVYTFKTDSGSEIKILSTVPING